MTDRVIVIGAGMGGLAAALDLARAGRSVLVIDSAAGPGGKMRTLPSVAGPVDAGPTVMTLRPVFEALFTAAGARLEDHVQLVPEPVLARHFWRDGTRLDLHADHEASRDAVRDAFGPGAAAEFTTFCTEAAALFAAFSRPMIEAAHPQLGGIAAAALARPGIWPLLRPGRTLAGHLAARFRNPHLRQLFGRYATYVGGDPRLTPAVLSLVWQAEAAGIWRVEGGMYRLAQAIAALAETCGAEFDYGTGVHRILCREGRVTGVALGDGRRLEASAVVHGGDPAALVRGLLGPEAVTAVKPGAVQPRSLSAEVWAFAARAERPAPLHHHNVFFGADPEREFGPIARGAWPEDPTLYVCAQDRGSGLSDPSGPERFEIIMNAPPLLTGGAHAEDDACPTPVFPILARSGLTFDPQPETPARTGPSGFDRLFPGSDGALYGRSPHGLLAPFLRPRARSALPGLYLAGGGTHPGAGIPMATLSGRHAAAAIMADRASMSALRPTGMPGGISTPSPRTANARSRSSAS